MIEIVLMMLFFTCINSFFAHEVGVFFENFELNISNTLKTKAWSRIFVTRISYKKLNSEWVSRSNRTCNKYSFYKIATSIQFHAWVLSIFEVFRYFFSKTQFSRAKISKCKLQTWSCALHRILVWMKRNRRVPGK